ncbi:MAG: hypothetical protein A2283_00550 [Lentisphaerae bacterium RIFOXYA12_FULL_48_11]|nr:MAG: hypothetical protein A2283_00550 [Lentisphaerae bacterium RIFOXYA12_FULL_48_11]
MLSSCTTLTDKTRTGISFYPEIIPAGEGAIQNAGSGTEIWNGGSGNGVTNLVKYAVRVSDYAVNSMIRPGWVDHETGKGEYNFAKLDKHFEYCIQYGQKLNIGCFVTSAVGKAITIDGALCSYPLYVHEAMQKSVQKDVISLSFFDKKNRWEPNFENQYYFERYDALLKAFAAYLEQPATFGGKTIQRKKLVRCIEMRHFGFWGEGAYPKHLVPSDSKYLIRFADSFIRHFPDIRIVVPTNGMVYSPTYDAVKEYHFYLLTAKNKAGLLGIFRDNWGWDERSSYYQKIYYSANRYEQDGVKLYELLRDRWKLAPLVGEPGRTSPKGDFRPYSCLLEQVKYLHPAVVRNCNVSDGTGANKFNPDNYSIFDDPPALDQFHQMYSIIGFRYLFTSAKTIMKNDNMRISVDWLNIGLTPTYDKWNIRYFITDETGKEIWSGSSALDLRTVVPDENTAPGVVKADKAKRHTDSFPNVPTSGKLYLQIVDPDDISPPMALSIKGRTRAGAYLLGVF